MTVFSEKLDRLRETAALAAGQTPHSLAAAIGRSSAETVVAVGSGGSAVAAEYFASCRVSLGCPPTIVTTPLTYVEDAVTVAPLSVWLFSASGANPDIIAAFEHAQAIGARSIELVTSTPESDLARRIGHERVHVASVADPKDGFLATHSLIAAATRLLFATDHLSSGLRASERADQVAHYFRTFLGADTRATIANEAAVSSPGETLLLLFDPHMRAAALLIETSLWESGLLPVQTVDFRNFAHGRHVWLSSDRHSASAVALLTDEGMSMWQAIEGILPETVPRLALRLGAPSRGSLYSALLWAFAYIEALGERLMIDPGRPGVSDFGRALFALPALRTRAQVPLAVRRKRLAARRVDLGSEHDWRRKYEEAVALLREAKIGGIVLDYDGTVVSTERRLEPPSPAIIVEIVRLIEGGVTTRFATGRGGSIGTMLRSAFPIELHESIVVGYYNGGLLSPLSRDIESDPPAQDPAILQFFETLGSRNDLFAGRLPRMSTLQISIESGTFRDFAAGLQELVHLLDTEAPGLRMIRSGHSVDIVPISSSKAEVVRRLRSELDTDVSILALGDSGDSQGNDFELFSDALGISVGRVCHRPDKGWNFCPGTDGGPLELLRILQSLKLTSYGEAKFDVHYLFPEE